MRIGIIASARFPVCEPFAGGLEAHTWALAQGLTARGHDVALYAAPGSDPNLRVEELTIAKPVISARARADVSMSPEWWMQEHHAYLSLMLHLARSDVDVVHNNSLHYLPIAMSSSVPAPVVTTLHTPPTPWLESAIQAPDRCATVFAAVSRHAAAAWSHVVSDPVVVRNGIDTERWQPGAGGGSAVWSGRLVPEKGVHLAAAAAQLADIPLRIAGPIMDTTYFETHVRPLLGPNVEYVGHLRTDELSGLIGTSSVSLVTPCWEEPFGLVVAESLACGTPVAGFARGALPELIDDRCGRLVAPDDVRALATAVVEAAALDRGLARAHAVQTCSVASMIDGYERLYHQQLSAAA